MCLATPRLVLSIDLGKTTAVCYHQSPSLPEIIKILLFQCQTYLHNDLNTPESRWSVILLISGRNTTICFSTHT